MSPELWRKLKAKESSVKYDAYKNDIFSLGMVLLEIVTGLNLQEVYEQNGEFNWNQLSVYVKAFKNKCGDVIPHLYNAVYMMLNLSTQPVDLKYIIQVLMSAT